MKFNNREAKRDYKNLVSQLGYEDRQILSGILKEAEENVRDIMLDQKFCELTVPISYYESDYAITLIGWVCDGCNENHVEIALINQYILN